MIKDERSAAPGTAVDSIIGLTASIALVALLLPAPARGQSSAQAQSSVPAPVSITLDEAVQIALARSYAVREAGLDVESGDAQVREALGLLVPQVSLNSTYTRNVKSANPFAGSDAGGLFQTLGFLDWLAYNEEARTDDDPGTSPISLADFSERRQDGLDAAGVVTGGSDNPFAVPNQANATISVEQTVFDMRAFLGASGARKYLRALNRAALDRQEQLIVSDVRQAFYGALLAQESATVVGQSVRRTRLTRDETAQRVAQGILPKYQRLSADVELANLESNLIRSTSQAQNSVDQLKLLIGLPVDQEIVLHGALEDEVDASIMTVSVTDAVAAALEHRSDLEQARLGIKLQDVQVRATRAEYFPTLSAFANIGYVGSVPASRQSVLSDPDDPFSFSIRENGVFSDSYWDLTASVGFRLSWTIFNGLQSRNRVQQQVIEAQRTQLRYDQLEESIKLEVQSALRQLQATQRQIDAQRQNVSRAELNYEHANARLLEGVASQLEERQASELLDQSRLTYLQAVHDYLAARNALEAAMGATPGASAEITFTANDETAGEPGGDNDLQ